MTTEITVSEQVISFLLFSLTGAASGIIYDIFKVLRQDIRRNSSGAVITDIVTPAIIFLFVLISFYKINGIRIMIYHIIGYFLGGTVYFFALSTLFFPVIRIFFKFFKKILIFLLYPAKFSCIMILRVCLFISKPFKKIPRAALKIFTEIRKYIRAAYKRIKKI